MSFSSYKLNEKPATRLELFKKLVGANKYPLNGRIMKMGMKNYFLSAIILCFQFANLKCLNVDNLGAQFPVYGLASVTDRNFSTCFRELSEFKDAVDAGKVWGLKILDASGRPPAGFLYGNNLWVGSHIQCMDIRNKKDLEIRLDKVNRTLTPFDYPPYELAFVSVMMKHNSTIQYHARLPLDFTVQLGLCVPKSCSQKEIFNLSEKYFSNNPLTFQKKYQVTLEVFEVRMLEEGLLWFLMLPKTIIFIIIVAIVLILTTVGTICDVKRHNRKKNIMRAKINGFAKEKPGYGGGLPPVEMVPSSNDTIHTPVWMEILRCFSFYSNVKRWSKTSVPPDSLPIVYGLRFLAMGWVILVHTSFYQADFLRNPPYAWRLTENFLAQIFSNSTYCVDTYLFLSGFLLAYLYFNSTNPHDAQRKQFSFLTNVMKFTFMYLNRFLRLTPAYAFVILFSNVIYTYYSKASSLYFSERPDIVCDKYWWRNLLYINNLYPRSEMCLSWSWYVAIEMQFFTIGTTLVLLSTTYFKTAVTLVFLILLTQISATTYISYSIGYIPTLDDQLETLDAIYDLPWTRIGPYMVGIITAYIFVIKMKKKLVLKEKTRLTLWVIFPLLNLWILFTLYTRKLSVEFSAIYMGISRPLWGLGIAWFVIALSTGNARLLEKLLSYPAWIPLGRLIYCAYLLNPVVVTMLALGSEEGNMMSIPEMANTSQGTLLITMMMSFLFSILFESPFILLSKIILKSTSRNKSEHKEETTHSNDSLNVSTDTVNTIA